MHSIVMVLLIALGAGAGGATIGGILGIIIKKPKKLYISCMMGFAAGAMLGMALFEMLPEAYDEGGIAAVLVGLTVGCLVVFGFEMLKRYLEKKKRKIEQEGGVETVSTNSPLNGATLATANFSESTETIVEENETGETALVSRTTLTKETQSDGIDKRKLFKVGIAILIAIMFHDLAEGVAIGAMYHIERAVLFGIVMAMHKIPEGLAIAVPLKASGMARKKIIGLTLSVGIPTMIGALIGYFAGMNDVLIAYALAFAAGVMLCVVFSEMLPTAYKFNDKKHYLTTLCVIIGTMLIVVFATIL